MQLLSATHRDSTGTHTGFQEALSHLGSPGPGKKPVLSRASALSSSLGSWLPWLVWATVCPHSSSTGKLEAPWGSLYSVMVSGGVWFSGTGPELGILIPLNTQMCACTHTQIHTHRYTNALTHVHKLTHTHARVPCTPLGLLSPSVRDGWTLWLCPLFGPHVPVTLLQLQAHERSLVLCMT